MCTGLKVTLNGMQNQPVLTGLHIDEIIQRKPDSFRGALGDDDRNFEKNRIVGIQWKNQL